MKASKIGVDKPQKPDYQSFLLRLWQVKEDDQPAWRASLEQVDSGEKQGFTSLDALFAYIDTLCRPDRLDDSTKGLD